MPKVELKNQGTSSTDSTTDTAGTQTILPNYRSRNRGKIKNNKSKINVLFLLFTVTIMINTILLFCLYYKISYNISL